MPEQYYLEDMWEGEVIFRDRYQFELKSLYTPFAGDEENAYSLEFYFFIPTALQITPQTYSRDQFYWDLTSYIRYKTPAFKVQELADLKNPRSPLSRIQQLLAEKGASASQEVQTELKLFGNILRSSVRETSKSFMQALKPHDPSERHQELRKELLQFIENMAQLRETFTDYFQELRDQYPKDPLALQTRYVDEFCSITIEQFLTHLLKQVRDLQKPVFEEVDSQLRKSIAHEIYYRQKLDYMSPFTGDKVRDEEQRTFRNGLLKKFVLDVLLLSTERHALMSRFQHFIGSFAAGVAMFIYLVLFVWQGEYWVINSIPFIIFTSVIYILKDRMKEGLKALSAKKAFEWFPDYSTEVRTHDKKVKLGELSESFTFRSESALPEEVATLRKEVFGREIPEAKRMRTIMYYRRRVTLNTERLKKGARRYEINDIFRYNISQFLWKASNPTEENLYLDVQTGALVKVPSPKVYHVNIILKQTSQAVDRKEKVEYKAFRLVIDKDGIKRLERLPVDGAGSP